VPLPVPIRRVGYRVAYHLLRVYWFVFRPDVRGVKCLLTRGEEVLLVRHTYGDRRWDLPGGTLHRGEDPAAAARREMEEELGVVLGDLVALGRLSRRVDHRRDRLHAFQAELSEPEVRLDLGELSAADWFSRDRLPTEVARYVRPILGLARPD